MEEHLSVIAGWLPSTGIRDIVSRDPSVFRDAPNVLLTIVDSAHNIADLRSIHDIHTSNDRFTVISTQPFLITGESLMVLLERPDFFTGFDELWLLRESTALTPPDDVTLVAPEQIKGEPPEALSLWMHRAGAYLGLGDGSGLNFAATDPAIVSRLGLKT